MMKRKYYAAALLLIMLCLAFCNVAVAAHEPVHVDQKVIITLSGSLPSPRETFTVVMQALDNDNPMPNGQIGGNCEIKIKGEKKTGNSGRFPTMTFTKPGEYQYKVWQKPGKHPRGTYDDTVYTMTVQVTNSADYKSFEVVVFFNDNKGGPKPDNDLFHNKYASEPGTITPTGVADDWPYYLAGSGVLMLMSLFLMTKLRRREALETDAGELSLDEDEIDG